MRGRQRSLAYLVNWKGVGCMVRSFGLAGMAAAFVCCGGQENLVRNPGFEETEPSGATVGWNERKPVYRFADGAGREGTRGLVFENGDPAFYSFPSQALDLRLLLRL